MTVSPANAPEVLHPDEEHGRHAEDCQLDPAQLGQRQVVIPEQQPGQAGQHNHHRRMRDDVIALAGHVDERIPQQERDEPGEQQQRAGPQPGGQQAADFAGEIGRRRAEQAADGAESMSGFRFPGSGRDEHRPRVLGSG
jgi:hypothetical protein